MILNNKITLFALLLVSINLFAFEDKAEKDLDEPIKNNDDYFEGNTVRYENRTYKEGIYTPVVFANNWELSDPFIQLGSDDVLNFYFDDLNEDLGDYSYTLIHCTYDWQASDLMATEFIDGFAENPINDFEESFNTYIRYINYRVQLPNADVKFTKSGNYILLVYENDDMESPVITQRFTVFEKKTEVVTDIMRPTDVNQMAYKQTIQFTIDHATYPIADPFQEIHVQILQNNRWDNAIGKLKPQFIQNNKLIYNYNDEASFDGNMEFRYLDLKSIQFKGEKIKSIKLEGDDFYHYTLFPEESRGYKQYLSQQDINGRFIIKNENDQSSHIDAGYAKVHFSLKADAPYEQGNVFVFGGLSNWQLDDRFKMTYNEREKMYELTAIVKQGYHNYLYALPEEQGINTEEIEGTHFQTENDYTILVYQRVFSEGYDRVIGYERENSRR